MNFETIKAGFQSYLTEKLAGSETEEQISIDSSVSIFMYSSEFKDYLVEEVGADVSIFSKSISEIMEMEYTNGKLVEAEDESIMTDILNEALSDETIINAFDTDGSGDLNEDEVNIFLSSLTTDEEGNVTYENVAQDVQNIQNGEYSAAAATVQDNTTEETTSEISEEDTTEISAEDDTAINELLEKAYANGTVIKALDTDGDGELSEEEKAAFEEFIKGYDGDDTSLSEEDIQSAVSEIIDGTFTYDTDDSDTVSSELSETEDTSSTGETEDTTSTSSTGSTGSTGSSSGTSSSSGSSSASSTEKTLDNMTLDELEAEKTTRESDVADARDEVSAVYSGENEYVQAAEAEYEDARAAYDEALENDEQISDDLKQRRDDNLNAIEEEENTINDLNISINEKDAEISEQKDVIATDKAVISGYKSSLSELKSQSSDDEEKQAEINQAIINVQAALDAAESQLDKDEADLEELKDNKADFEDSLETEEEKLADLEVERSEIEEEILANCSDETKTALEAFNEAKDNLAEVKEEQLNAAKANLIQAQSALDDVNDAINVKKQEEAEDEFAVSTATLPDGLFKGALEGQEDLVAEIAEEYGIEPEFLAAIICLESGYGTSNLAVNHNNFGGVTGSGDNGKTSSGFASYSSIEAGLEAMAKNLAAYSSRYSDVDSVDIDNVESIGNHYCVGGDWANQVKALYNQIKNM